MDRSSTANEEGPASQGVRCKCQM